MSWSTPGRPVAERLAALRVACRERVLDVAARAVGTPGTQDRDRWRRGAPVLLYHRVYRDIVPGGDSFGVSRAQFGAHLDELSETFEVVTVGELLRRLQRPAQDRPLAAISFDDGYECTHREAWPELQQRGLAATLFVDTARLDGAAPALSTAALLEMAEQGMEIGSHGVGHLDLTRLDETALQSEVEESRAELSRLLGGPPEGLAVPYGRFNDRTVAKVTEAGYDYLCTCRQDTTNVASRDELPLISRLEVNRGDDVPRLRRKLAGDFARVYQRWYRLVGEGESA